MNALAGTSFFIPDPDFPIGWRKLTFVCQAPPLEIKRHDSIKEMLFYAREYWSEESLTKRENGRKVYFDTRFPERKIVVAIR